MAQLPNPFLNSTVIPEPPAVASTADSACRLQNVARPDATAERDPHPISVSHSPDLISEHARSAAASSDLQPRAAAAPFAEPTSSTGGPQETPASAPTKNPDVGVLDAIDCIHEIFHYARKLMRGHQGFVLDEAEFLADVEEEPLFIRDGEHLRRWEA